MPLPAIKQKQLNLISERAWAWIVAVSALLMGGLLSALLALALDHLYQRQLQQRFDLLVGERLSRIEERFDDQVQRLDSLRRFFVSSDSISRQEFDGFAGPLLLRTQAYAWAPRVAGNERAAFEQQVREQGLVNFSIRELDADGVLRLAGPRAEYVPLLYSQTLSVLDSPLGFDLLAQPLRRLTLEHARSNGNMAVSQPMSLVGVEPAYARGVLLVAPVSRLPSVQVPSPQPYGYVTAAISMRQLLADGLPAPGEDNLAVRILDLSTEGAREVLFDSVSPAAPSSLRASRRLRLADHEYEVDVRPSEAFFLANHSFANVVGLLGGLLSVLLSILLYVLVSQRRRALSLVEQRTAQLRQREREWRGVLDAATQVAIIATDLRGVITTFNAGAEQMLGYVGPQVLGRLRLEDLLLAEELQRRAQVLGRQQGTPIPLSQAMLVEIEEGDGHEGREWTLVRRDGSCLSVSMLVTPMLDEDGVCAGHLAVCIDITERKRVHEALAARDRLLEKLSAHVPGGIYQFRLCLDGRSCFSYTSEGLRDIYEIEPQILRHDAQPVFERIHPQDLSRVLASIRHSAEGLGPWREEYRVCLPARGVRWVRGEATPERLPGGDVQWHGYLSDITDLKRVEEELRTLSVTDALTGVHNRRFFQERLQAELTRVAEGMGELAVIMLDIDHFKRINDVHGHAVGDQVLKEVCLRIGRRLRSSDVFCRLGGEEFLVLCPATNAAQAQMLARQLWESLRQVPFEAVGSVTASFGVACWRMGEGGDALLLRADSGVYAAKQAGRDRVQAELA